jgi:membrane protein DedA with SNARE-associated domain
MHWAKFLAFNTLGAALWVATWTSLGYLSGSHINAIYNTATQYFTYLAIAAALLILAYIGRRLSKRPTREPTAGD